MTPALSSVNLLSTYYRCPAEFVRFTEPGPLSEKRGYFLFGHDATCYGRLASGRLAQSPAENLYDALDAAGTEGAAVRLPFEASEIIENLRCERYAAAASNGETKVLGELVHKAYYMVRPLLPVSVRRHMQRLRLRDWDKLPFPAWPVDGTVETIHQRLLALSLKGQGLDEIPFIWFWPDGAPSCAIMTHDVETATGRDFCSQLMDVNDSYKIKSSFQVVPEKRYSVPERFLNSIRSRGFEVNVHDLNHDGHLFHDRTEFLRRVKRINAYVEQYGAKGFRSAVLYRNADWFDAFEISYDMSFPSVAHMDPQRGGCCTVMPYFVGKVLELPVTATQDYTLFNIFEDYSIELWKRQISFILEQHGLASFIVHPDYVIPMQAMATYSALLAHLAQLRAEGKIWIALPKHVDAWWRQRSRMELIRRNGAWRVDGEGKERARVAYAFLAGDKISYRIGVN
jgi:hypothetical protein